MIRPLETVADFLWPRECPIAGCGRASDVPGRFICSSCRALLPWYDESDGAALAYLEPVPELVNRFKFSHATWLAADFADILATSLRRKTRLDVAGIDVVVPVPLHPKRRRERGYDQCRLLARPVAAAIGRPYDETSFVRVRDTEHQSRLTEAERRVNLRCAFAVRRPERIRGRRVLLVDDVSTSGSTLEECVRTLKRAGAWRVTTYCLAETLKESSHG